MSRANLQEALRDEMAERKWDETDVACRAILKIPIVRRELEIARAVVHMIFEVPEATFGEEDAALLADAFGVSKEFFLNLERS